MAQPIRRIGILTGGGDCPGLNAVIRCVAKTGIFRYGLEVFGIEDGFQGLLENRIKPLNSDSVSGILARGGTILGTNNRCNPSRIYAGEDAGGNPIFEDRTEDCLANAAAHGLDAIVVIGGDGTMSCAAPFAQKGLNCIGVPKTIDNDIFGTEISFGFMTAVETATEALDKLHSTADSHHRVIVCEVMGRNAGWIALHAGIASGSDVILIPEIPFDLDCVCDFLLARNKGRGYSIVVCSEGAKPINGSQVVGRRDPTSPDPVRLGGIGAQVAAEVAERTKIDSRVTVLGHIQRGGSPVAADRILATQFGRHALDLLMSGAEGRMVVRRDFMMADQDLLDAANRQRTVPPDHPLIEVARSVRTHFGDPAADSQVLERSAAPTHVTT